MTILTSNALRALTADLNKYDYKKSSIYTNAMVWEKVVNRQQSVCPGPSAPSYVWGQVIEDDGEISIDFDAGVEGFLTIPMNRHGSLRHVVKNFNPFAHELSMGGVEFVLGMGWSCQDPYSYRTWEWLIKNGLSYDSRFLMRWTASYCDEGDCDCEHEVLWINPSIRDFRMTLDFPDFRILGSAA